MRRVLWLAVLLVAGMGALWVGGESWLAGQAQKVISAQPALDAGEVRPLRDPRRIGIRIDQPGYQDGVMSLSLPWADLWISPLKPQETRLTLPDRGVLRLGAQEHDLTMQRAEGLVRQPLLGGPVARADLRVEGLALDGRAVLETLDLRVREGALAQDAPAGAVSVYDAALSLRDFAGDRLLLPGLPPLPVSGGMSLEGSLRLWLDQEVAVQTLAGPVPPRLMGVETGDLVLQLGDHRARISGRIQPDAAGRAEGKVAIQTENAQAILDAAFDSGLLPASGRFLARSMLSRLSRGSGPEGGELRLSLTMRDGRMMLGPVPLGAAPMFPG